jgi:hypothetical protein
MKKIKVNSRTEEYVVKFQLKNKEGFVERREESVWFFSKDKHKQAEKEIINRYRGQGYRVEIISVIYQ